MIDDRRVEARAAEAGISLRGSCFCNPGAAEQASGFTPEMSARCFGAMARDGFDLDRLRACLGAPGGAIRISLGMVNVAGDVTRVDMILGLVELAAYNRGRNAGGLSSYAVACEVRLTTALSSK